jgi:hypothetical protein
MTTSRDFERRGAALTNFSPHPFDMQPVGRPQGYPGHCAVTEQLLRAQSNQNNRMARILVLIFVSVKKIY